MTSQSSITTDNTVDSGILDLVTPGEILRAEFIDPMGMTQAELSRATGITPACISEIVNGKRMVTAEVDLRLTRYLGLSEGYWLRLQMEHDLMAAHRRLGKALDTIKPRVVNEALVL